MSPEYSTLAGFNNQGSPVIEVRRAQTNVRAIDGQTVVIGGLRRQMTVEAVQGVPGLMNWKVVGPLFRTVGTELTESELICIVRPQIVSLPVKQLNRVCTQRPECMNRWKPKRAQPQLRQVGACRAALTRSPWPARLLIRSLHQPIDPASISSPPGQPTETLTAAATR